MENEVKKEVLDGVTDTEASKTVETTETTETAAITTKVEDTPAVEANISQEKEEESDAFITEKDTFDVRVSYYRIGGDFTVEGVDNEFDPQNPAVKHIDITFKYPSQGDYESIIAQNSYKTPDKMTLIDVMQMELTRIIVLIRKWSLKEEFSRMVDLDTKIVKAIANKVREKIGVKAIL